MGQLQLLGEPPASNDHAALANLAFPQAGHTGFVAAAGLTGGQTIIGGTAPGEHLSLQSTAHAARGVVQVIDSLRLVSGLIQDSGGATRITLAAASPHIALSGYIRAGDRLSVATDPDSAAGLKCSPTLSAAAGSLYVINGTPGSCQFTGPGLGTFYGFYASATASVQSAATASLYGLQFTAGGGGAGTLQSLYGCWTRLGLFSYSGASAPNLWSFYARQPIVMASTYPANATGMEIENMGGYNAAYNAIGIKIADQTQVTGNKYLIEAGPATPYLRLVGGGPPGAGLTNLHLNEGGTLRRVQCKDFSTLVAGDRVMVLV